jgi:signal transduction histidine kinase
LEDTLLQILAPLRRLLPVNIRLDTHFACPASIVDADPIELQRILINLALNARDAMPHGGSLVIETSLNRERNLVCWKMTDSGSGIPAAAEESVFQRYFTTKPARSGSGIGLHNVHRMVSEMGGTVTVESQPELGTTLVIELPCITATSSR